MNCQGQLGNTVAGMGKVGNTCSFVLESFAHLSCILYIVPAAWLE